MNQRHIAASVRAQLLNKARAEKLSFNLLITHLPHKRMHHGSYPRKGLC
jgi:hypothetical protein